MHNLTTVEVMDCAKHLATNRIASRSMMPETRSKRAALMLFFASLMFCVTMLGSDVASAFTHVVQPGETLASIAERYYGRISYERVLVYANSLDACGGFPVVAGMRLEIPAVAHHRVAPGDTWQTLARDLLGGTHRGEMMARANRAKSWIPPEEGADVIVPYNLRFLVQQRETSVSISKRFFRDDESAWMLDRYNSIDGKALHRGDVVLVPLSDLPLTEQGQAAARASDSIARSEGGGKARQAQRQVAAQLPQVLADLRGGHYVQALVSVYGMLGLGDLTKPQIADLYRIMTEAYVALDASGLAAQACQVWREADPSVVLDEVYLSPKIIVACKAGQQPAAASSDAAFTDAAPCIDANACCDGAAPSPGDAVPTSSAVPKAAASSP